MSGYFQAPREWMSLGTYREPAPRRLTWEELLAEEFTPSARPEPIADLSGLSPEERRRARQDSVFSGLASIGALLQGDQRRAQAGVGELAEIRDRAIAGGNARQEQTWQQENQQRAAEAERGKREQGAKALLGMYERVSEGETPAFAQRAEQAARAGSMAELTKMDQERGMRARSREVGFNPDDFTIEELQQRLSEALEARKMAEQARLKEEEARRLGQVKNDLEIAQEEALRAKQLKGYEPPQYEPLDRIRQKAEIQAQTSAKYREPDAPAKPRWEVRSGPADPLTGAPGPLVRVNPDTGVAYPVEPPRSIELRVADIQSVVGVLPPRIREQVAADLAAGKPPRQIVAEIRAARGGQ